MQEIHDTIDAIQTSVHFIKNVFDLDKIQSRIKVLQTKLSDQNIWDESIQQAQNILREKSKLENLYAQYQDIITNIEECKSLIKLNNTQDSNFDKGQAPVC